MNNLDILHGKFDIEVHKANFVNYLEVVILEDGTIEYAIPSHQEKLINICTNKLNVTREELCDMTPMEYYCNFTTWLCDMSGCISVWDKFYIGVANDAQIRSLDLLSEHNLYIGVI